MKGGSFISTGNSASMHYRVGFRRHFYQFAGLRYVKGEKNSSNNNEIGICQSDECV